MEGQALQHPVTLRLEIHQAATGMSAVDPLFWAFQDSLVGGTPRSRPILGNRILTPIRDGESTQAARRTVILNYPTINFDKRYLRFVDKV